mmetsp:Transcript_17049/g.23861  ORF Transcript_17049/g.23861 Transcript_17049/m.23861 type:complete len:117 (+) Transcript_17049:223-573(+)
MSFQGAIILRAIRIAELSTLHLPSYQILSFFFYNRNQNIKRHMITSDPKKSSSLDNCSCWAASRADSSAIGSPAGCICVVVPPNKVGNIPKVECMERKSRDPGDPRPELVPEPGEV